MNNIWYILSVAGIAFSGLIACSPPSDPPENGEDNNAAQHIALPLQLSRTRALTLSSIQGFLQVDGDKIHTLTLKNGQATAHISDLAAGTHTFGLRFRFQTSAFGAVVLAEGEKALTVRANQSIALNFSESDYRYPDDDNDGLSNLKELDRGWSPVDKNDPDFLPDMVVVPAGSFEMGSADDEPDRDDDEGLHLVQLDAFAIGKYEVTRAEFQRFVEATGYQTGAEKNSGELEGCYADDGDGFRYLAGASWRAPQFAQSDAHPAVCINWYDATAYVEWLSRETGRDYRLPTEAEWEYAARAGVSTRYSFGDNSDEFCAFGNAADRDTERVYEDYKIVQCRDGYIYTAPVGTFAPNASGALYDFHGNVWEWTCSEYRADYSGAEQRCLSRSDNAERTIRGGSWINGPIKTRLAFRFSIVPSERASYLGFRVAQSVF